MKWFVIVLGILNAIGTLSSVVSLSEGKPWPRTSQRKASCVVFGMLVNLGFAAWAGYLLLTTTFTH